MRSANFEFLKSTWKELSGLGGFAEQYAYPDPESAAVKLRSFAEQVVDFIWHKAKLPRPEYQANLNDKLNQHSFSNVVPRVVVSKLHALRMHGNKAAHGEKLSSRTALWLVEEAFTLGQWLFIAYGGGSRDECPEYKRPAAPTGATSPDDLKSAKKAVLQRLAAQEAEMQNLLAELEASRSAAQNAEATLAELQTSLEAGITAANALEFSEKETRRRLIDSMLVAAGWDVGSDGANTEQVGQEVPVLHQPTETTTGSADYVLYNDDGTPLAVIEAKKTAVDVESGRTQAKCYADGLAEMTGVRPLIFYTNGYDISFWNDAENEPPRSVFGFHSKDSMQYAHFRRAHPLTPSKVGPDVQIAGRPYQIEAVKRVVERFASGHRKALIVQATGTGKTRVAVSLCSALINAKRVRRVLFLCDRRELRRQAHNVFKQHLPSEPRVLVTARTAQDRNKRIYLATYPAMMKCFESFDIGFFDLIIADESHRSIYNRYRDLVRYFDGFVVGLTATPRGEISFNTYDLFACEDNDPTTYYAYEEAVNARPPYLSRFEVQTFTTPFLRDGIKYSQMTPEQKTQLEEQEDMPAAIEHDLTAVDKQIFNKDTNRRVIRNLMENGIRDASGTHVGKSIVFARNHNHAVLLQNLFDEMYPQYGGNFCRVIDNYDPRAEELIDDFKGQGRNAELTIAISVDMLDTGIDVPEVVNLVFAKPVYSYVKFWQMIGRGTRLCENLFGPGKNKEKFLIFDHWGVFEFFEERYRQIDANPPKSLPQRLFEARMSLADEALNVQDTGAFDLAIDLIQRDIADLPEKTIAVREMWKQIKSVQREEILKQFDANTKGVLLQDIAPLMQWRNIAGHEAAYQFDLRMCHAQIERLRNSSRYADLTDDIRNQVQQLQMNLSQVRAKSAAVAEASNAAFWNGATVADIERIRKELRGIMKYRQPSTATAFQPKVIDVTEDDALIERKPHNVTLEGLELAAYRARVEEVLIDLFDENATLQRIKDGQPVTEDDLRALTSLVLTQDPDLDLSNLLDYYPETAGSLDVAIRNIIGLDAKAVRARFEIFQQSHAAALTAQQHRFINMLQNHIARYGSITVERLYEDPFTSIHSDGLDGVFTDDATIDELIDIIGTFSPTTEGSDSE